MAEHKNLKEYRASLKDLGFNCRDDYLRNVKYAKINDTGDTANNPSLRVLIFAQVMGFLPTSYKCPECGGDN